MADSYSTTLPDAYTTPVEEVQNQGAQAQNALAGANLQNVQASNAAQNQQFSVVQQIKTLESQALMSLAFAPPEQRASLYPAQRAQFLNQVKQFAPQQAEQLDQALPQQYDAGVMQPLIMQALSPDQLAHLPRSLGELGTSVGGQTAAQPLTGGASSPSDGVTPIPGPGQSPASPQAPLPNPMTPAGAAAAVGLTSSFPNLAPQGAAPSVWNLKADPFGKPQDMTDHGFSVATDQYGNIRPLATPGGEYDPNAQGNIAGAKASAEVPAKTQEAANKKAIDVANAAQLGIQEKLADQVGALSNQYTTAGHLASNTIPRIDTILSLAPGAIQSGNYNQLEQKLIGLNPLSTQDSKDALAKTQEMSKYLGSLVLGQDRATQNTGHITDAFNSFMKTINPSNDLQGPALVSMLYGARAWAERDAYLQQQAAKFSSNPPINAATGRPQTLVDFDAQMQKQAPIIAFLGKYLTPQQMQGPLGQEAHEYLRDYPGKGASQ